MKKVLTTVFVAMTLISTSVAASGGKINPPKVQEEKANVTYSQPTFFSSFLRLLSW